MAIRNSSLFLCLTLFVLCSACDNKNSGEYNKLNPFKKGIQLTDSQAYTYAENAALQIKNDCITFGSADTFAVEVITKRVDQEKDKFIIELKASWEGSITTINYWFIGKLICDPNGSNALWLKIEDSGNLGKCTQERLLQDVSF